MKQHLASSTGISRRAFLKMVGAASLGLVLPGSLSNAEKHPALATPGHPVGTPKKNVLVFVLDALSAHHIQLYGYPRTTMPNLSRLIDKAVVFHNHYSGGNFTSPGTASLLTGTLPWTHRALSLSGEVIDSLVQRNVFSTFPGYYRTAYTHNAYANRILRQFEPLMTNYIPRERLFLRYDRIVNWLFENDEDIANVAWARGIKNEEGSPYSIFFSDLYRQFSRNLDEYKSDFPFGVPVINEDNYFLLEHAIDYLMKAIPEYTQPFFGYFHFLPPHYPYNTRKDFYQFFRNDGFRPLQKPEHLFSQAVPYNKQVRLNRFYDEFILYADAEFSRLFDHLERSGLLEDTWVVLTADHGELFERGVVHHTTPLLNQAIIRIPLIFWEPGRNTRLDIHQRTSAIDVLPTLLQVTGHPIPEWVEGRVMPPFTDEADTSEKEIFVVEAQHTSKGRPITAGTLTCIRDQYKLIWYFGYPELAQTGDLVELYDIETDPDELVNLASARRNIVDEMVDLLKVRLSESNQPYL